METDLRSILSAAVEAAPEDAIRCNAMPTNSSASDTNQESLTIAQPTWDADGSPNTLPAFVEAIIKYLPKKNRTIGT